MRQVSGDGKWLRDEKRIPGKKGMCLRYGVASAVPTRRKEAIKNASFLRRGAIICPTERERRRFKVGYFFRRKSSSSEISTTQITLSGLLLAASIILTRILSFRFAIGGIEGIRIGLGGLPLLMAGVLMGPVTGGVVGILSDVIGYFINPMGPYMPHFTLTSALNGIIPGLLLLKKEKETLSLKQLASVVAITRLIASTILVPYFLYIVFHLPLMVTLPPRIVSLVIEVPLYTLFLHQVLRRVPVRFLSVRKQ